MEVNCTLPPPSDEQIAIVNAVKVTNVIVDACAGSGKTTTVLHIALSMGVPILLLTYNSRLRAETITRAGVFGATNLTTHTYHSFAYRYISRKCRTDQGIIDFIESGNSLTETAGPNPPRKAVPKYDLIIIDEGQDMTGLYYRMVQKLIEVNLDARLCIVGDQRQSIYNFNGADARYITLADRLYPREWMRLTLSTSYRLTSQMADFINNCVTVSSAGTAGGIAPNPTRINSTRAGPLPRYIVYDNPQCITNEIKHLLSTGYTPGDIFILAPSIKSTNNRNPVRRLANNLSANQILVYIPGSDDSTVDDEVIAEKLVFSSFHQSKGLERKVVFVVGFDDTYNKYYHKGDADVCSNAMYVAITRARERLYLYHSAGADYCKFLHNIQGYVSAEGLEGAIADSGDNPSPPAKIAVTRLIAHVSSDIISAAMKCIHVEVIREAEESLDIPVKTGQTRGGVNYIEEVSALNGIAIPAYYEKIVFDRMTIAEELINTIEASPASAAARTGAILRVSEAMRSDDPAQLLWLCNMYESTRTGLSFHRDQIRDYGWMRVDQLQLACGRIIDTLGGNPCARMEVPVSAKLCGYTIAGRIDFIDTRVVELKCTSALTPEHHLQLAIYGYMLMNSMCSMQDNSNQHPHYQFLLFNVMTNELVELRFDPAEIRRVIAIIICTKYHQCGGINDAEFIRNTTGVAATPGLCQMCTEAFDSGRGQN